MKLNWFCPLPPARTEIANYAARLLPLLRQHAQLTLWTDQAEWEPGLEAHATIRRYEADKIPWAEINRADVNIYHIGNNPHCHGPIWEVSRRRPGIVILHELSMQHLFAGLYTRAQDFTGFAAHMVRYYGNAGRAAAEKFWRNQLPTDYLAEHFPLTPLAVEDALGVLVHTPECFEQLKRMNRWPVYYSPLPQAATAIDCDRLAALRSVKLGQPYRLILFGHISRNRRLSAVLQALAGFPHEERFHLDVYGKIFDHDFQRAQIDVLGLEQHVTLHGYVSDAVLDSALDSAHLALNLRYPTMGEASASQLRIWDHALPTLVTSVGWYATVPESAVGFVRPDCEIADLQEHLHAFLRNPTVYLRKGEAGRRLLEERHRPEEYVRALLDLAERVRRSRPRTLAPQLARRVAEEMEVWTNAKGPEEAYRRVAEEIYRIAS